VLLPAAGGVGSGEDVLPIKVLRSDGWEFREWDGGAAGEKKYKPGWIATAAGAVLRVELDTDFGAEQQLLQQGLGEKGQLQVQLTYLTSYEHMGKARASCVEGCTCNPAVLDAHAPKEHHSVPKVLKLPTTASRRCVVQLEVLLESGSGEHKFKLMQAVVSTLMDVSGELAALGRLSEEAVSARMAAASSGLPPPKQQRRARQRRNILGDR
jgi:hypothetical protein